MSGAAPVLGAGSARRRRLVPLVPFGVAAWVLLFLQLEGLAAEVAQLKVALQPQLGRWRPDRAGYQSAGA